ncbi:hypothetical protein J7J62_04045 [bacterium]|nr:hypothetical protein [bacterium]
MKKDILERAVKILLEDKLYNLRREKHKLMALGCGDEVVAIEDLIAEIEEILKEMEK